MSKTYYVRSTGEIIGPNFGETLKKANRNRKSYGNLFNSKRDAERGAKYIKIALKIAQWRAK